MNLAAEKEKIKKEIDLIDDMRVIKALKKVLADYDADEDHPVGMVNEPPLTEDDMAVPGGRVPTDAQMEEWLDMDEGESMSGEDAMAYSLKLLEEYRSKRKAK